MKSEYIGKIYESLFLAICLSLIFCTTPQSLRISLSAGLSSKLSWLFIFFGLLVTAFNTEKSELERQYNFTLVLKYISIYVFFLLLSLIIGLYRFPYYDSILNAPTIQFDKAQIIYEFLINHKIYLSKKEFISVWMILRPIRNFFLETIFTFGCTYTIYIWFKGKEKLCIKILIKSVLITVVILLVYSAVEIPYVFYQNEFCKYILIHFNPILHDIKDNGTWWPPLLWPDLRLRSVFAEPSYMGIYSAYAMPWLWYSFISAKKKSYKLSLLMCIALFSFCIFLTKSRTSTVILFSEIALLMLMMVFFKVKYKCTSSRKNIVIMFITLVAFLSANFFLTQKPSSSVNSRLKNQVQSYLEENVGSLNSSNKRSNKARFSMMRANFKMGLDHPIFGVGVSLRQAYTIRYLPIEAFDDDEVKGWIQNQKDKGVMKGGFPSLGEYTTRFAETGFIGVFLFFLPAGYLVIKIIQDILKKINLNGNIHVLLYYLISFLGILATGIGESINVTYCYWVMLGVGFVLVNSSSKIPSKREYEST